MVSSGADSAPVVWTERVVAGQRWHYATTGQGCTRGTVLMLHGFPDCAAHWLPVAHRLSDSGYRCLVPEMPGYGGTDPLPHGHDIESIAEALLALMAELMPGHAFYVAGHDWGAVVTYAMCNLDPTRIRSAVTMAVPPLSTFQRNLLRHAGQLRRSWYMGYFQLPGKPESALADPSGALLRRLWRTWSPAIADVDPYVARVQQALRSPVQQSAALAYYRALFGRGLGGWQRWRSNYRLAQRKLAVPIRIVAGLQDGCVGSAIFADCAAAFVHPHFCDYQPVLQAGHFMNIDQPELVVELARDWFARSPV